MTVDPGSDAGRATVRCPKGHSNAWNYKFCAECGLPIGLVSWPSDEPAPAATTSRSRGLLLIAAIAVVAIAAVVTVVVVVASPRNDTERPASAEGIAAAGVPTTTGPASCARAPVIEAESIDLRADGLAVSASFMSSCGGGDVESNSALVITVAEGESDVAAGSFDFSADPMMIEPAVPARRTLVFPAGMYWRTPGMLSGSPELTANRQGKSDLPTTKTGSGPTTMVATDSAKPAHGSVEDVAEAVLGELRDDDYPVVQSLMSNLWVPQVSSKRVGLVVDGKTLTNADILRNHLALRQRFDEARLVWSGNWTTFSTPDFWVTVVGPSYVTPDEANQWCDSNEFGVDDCFAKYLSTLFGVEGTTVYRK